MSINFTDTPPEDLDIFNLVNWLSFLPKLLTLCKFLVTKENSLFKKARDKLLLASSVLIYPLAPTNLLHPIIQLRINNTTLAPYLYGQVPLNVCYIVKK